MCTGGALPLRTHYPLTGLGREIRERLPSWGVAPGFCIKPFQGNKLRPPHPGLSTAAADVGALATGVDSSPKGAQCNSLGQRPRLTSRNINRLLSPERAQCVLAGRCPLGRITPLQGLGGKFASDCRPGALPQAVTLRPFRAVKGATETSSAGGPKKPLQARLFISPGSARHRAHPPPMPGDGGWAPNRTDPPYLTFHA